MDTARKTGPAPQPRTIYLIKRLQHQIQIRLEEILQPLEITATQYTILSLLAHRGDLSSAQLSRRFSVTPQTMIKQIAALEAKGLIARTESDENRRVLQTRLSPAGRALLRDCEAAVDAFEAQVFGRLEGHDLPLFRKTMEGLLAGLGPRPAQYQPY